MEQHKHCSVCGTVLESNGDCSECDVCEFIGHYVSGGCGECPDRDKCDNYELDKEDKNVDGELDFEEEIEPLKEDE